MSTTVSNSPASYTTGLYGEVVVPIGGVASAAQAAAGTTASVTAGATGAYAFASSTQADALITLVDAMRTALISAGVIKGSA